VAWEFVLAIYEAGWDHLIASTNSDSFRSKTIKHFEKLAAVLSPDSNPKGKISRVPPPIPP